MIFNSRACWKLLGSWNVLNHASPTWKLQVSGLVAGTKFKDLMVKDRADGKVAVCNVCKKRTRRTWALMQNSDPPQFCHYNCMFANI